MVTLIAFIALAFSPYSPMSDSVNSSGVLRGLHQRQLLSIGEHENNLILNAQSIAQSGDGTLLISDKLDHNVKVFTARGRKTREFGKRGRDKGEFQGPGAMDAFGELIAVADYASPRVQLFNKKFDCVGAFNAPGPVFDLAIDGRGKIWCGVLTERKGQTLFQCEPSGEILQSIALRSSSGDLFDDIFSLAIDRSGIIVVAYNFINKIEVWRTDGRFIREFEAPGIIQRPPRKKLASKALLQSGLEFPSGNVAWSCALDPKGNIYVLLADFTANPNRDVYVFDTAGNCHSILTLQEPAAQLWIDKDGSLYTIEQKRTLVRKYTIY